jgi:hypothetical protein
MFPYIKTSNTDGSLITFPIHSELMEVVQLFGRNFAKLIIYKNTYQVPIYE